MSEVDRLLRDNADLRGANAVLTAEIAALKTGSSDRDCNHCVFWCEEWEECDRHDRRDMVKMLWAQGCPDWREPAKGKEES